jgi:hypothetical protein
MFQWDYCDGANGGGFGLKIESCMREREINELLMGI